jgi:hypothetical protein
VKENRRLWSLRTTLDAEARLRRLRELMLAKKLQRQHVIGESNGEGMKNELEVRMRNCMSWNTEDVICFHDKSQSEIA